jgi:tRNASer (uridine44-2'-O)-methyltransferase
MDSIQSLCKKFNLKLEKSINCDIDEKSFENSVKIYINKPQVINKWTAGSIIIEDENIYTLIQNENDKNLINLTVKNPLYEIENREFLAKNLKLYQNINYLILYDRILQIFILKPYFIAKTEARKYCACWHNHGFEYDKLKKCINLYVYDAQSSSDDNISWLSNILLKKIANWSLNILNDDDSSNCMKLTTLTLYKNMLADYYKLYQELKEKYSNELSSINWLELTNTNPEKFIHEDISIATHLILTWTHFNYDKSNIKFADLGCGNGLLVYILNQEGYNGFGIDLRKRKIWDFFCNTDIKYKMKLIEAKIDPRVDQYFDTNWLIGNHSDELSPWLPLIANRAGNCNLYLIPCCFFDFNNKYNFSSLKKNETRYDNYVGYLTNVFNLNGFNVFRDKLRIPSTKNIVLVGIRNPEKGIEYEKLDVLVSNQSDAFKIRDFEEEKMKSSRNCTRIDGDLKEQIVKRILECVLKDGMCNETIRKYDDTVWMAGRTVNLIEIIKLFEKEVLVNLKKECGGLKTLIKNYNQLFEVVDNDFIKLRVEQIDKSGDKMKFFKTKNCLFDLYHPNGCLLESSKCCFVHKSS